MRREVPEPPKPPDHLRAADPREWMRLWPRVIADPSVKCTGYALTVFADYRDGSEIRPGNEKLMKATGLKDKAVRDALRVIRDWGFAWRYIEGSKAAFIMTKDGKKRPNDEYRLTIPVDYSAVPMLDPDWNDTGPVTL